MNEREFTTIISEYLRKELGNILNLSHIKYNGIDLSDDEVGVELKCRYKKYYPNYAIHQYQYQEFVEQNPGKELYWGFVFYDLKNEINNLTDKYNKELIIKDVEVQFRPWDFVTKFPVSKPKTGPYIYVNTNKHILNGEYVQERFGEFSLLVPKDSILLKKIHGPPVEIQEKIIQQEDIF